MKTGYYFLTFIYVLVSCHIIQADLFDGLLNLNDNNGPSSNSVVPVSLTSTSPPPPPANHPSSKPNTSPDTKENPNPNPLQPHTQPPPIQSSSHPPSSHSISSDPNPPPHIPSTEPSSNNPPSPSPSSSPPPASSNIENASATVEAPPSSQSSKNTPHSTTPSTASTDTSNGTPSKSHSPGNANNAPSRASNNAKAKNSNSHEMNDSASTSSSVGLVSPSISMVPENPSPSSDSTQNSGSGTIAVAGAIVGCVVGLSMIAAIMMWCRKRGSSKRKNGISDDGFKSTEDYSIGMHSPGMVKTTSPGNNNGMMDMPAPMTFDYSRRLVAAPSSPIPPMANPNIPVYTDEYQHHHQQQPKEYEQEYHHQQISPHDYHQQPLQQEYCMYPPQDLTAEGTGNYFYQSELTKWDYDPQQLQNNNNENFTVMDPPGAGMMTDPNAPYYSDPYHKPIEIADHHAYKPNAI